MRKHGKTLQALTNVFNVPEHRRAHAHLLDLCMAPGGFLDVALSINPGAQVTAFTLPVELGGHRVLLSAEKCKNLVLKELDITMLAADMGTDNIPESYPDKDSFLPKAFAEGRNFDIAICDGNVLRTHVQPEHRDLRKTLRLLNAQLILALEHLMNGGTMIMLLQKLEASSTVVLLHQWSQFASIKLHKHYELHARKSSFYLIASNVQVAHEAAVTALQTWKQAWRVTTFGTDQEYRALITRYHTEAENLLASFGPALLDMGQTIWKIQASALSRAPYMKRGTASTI